MIYIPHRGFGDSPSQGRHSTYPDSLYRHSEEDLEAEGHFGVMALIPDEEFSDNTVAEKTDHNGDKVESLDLLSETGFGVFVPPYSGVDSFEAF